MSYTDPEGLLKKNGPTRDWNRGPNQLPKDAKKELELNQQKYENDSWKCLFMACEATKEIKKAWICVESTCTTCEGNVFRTGRSVPYASAYDPATTTCVCSKYGFDIDYKGGPPPGLTAPGR